jgi:hypothetical protein
MNAEKKQYPSPNHRPLAAGLLSRRILQPVESSTAFQTTFRLSAVALFDLDAASVEQRNRTTRIRHRSRFVSRDSVADCLWYIERILTLIDQARALNVTLRHLVDALGRDRKTSELVVVPSSEWSVLWDDRAAHGSDCLLVSNNILTLWAIQAMAFDMT